MDDYESMTFEEQLEWSRNHTESERLAKVWELNARHEERERAIVREMYPQADEQEIFLRVAARRLGRELMIKVYGWDPDLHP